MTFRIVWNIKLGKIQFNHFINCHYFLTIVLFLFFVNSNVQTIPKIITELKDLKCCDGDAVTLECKVEATPPPNIRWEKGGKVCLLLIFY